MARLVRLSSHTARVISRTCVLDVALSCQHASVSEDVTSSCRELILLAGDIAMLSNALLMLKLPLGFVCVLYVTVAAVAALSHRITGA